MTKIFYDLETTDRNTIGQILNYAFIAVDDSWKIISELCGDVKISPLQLPQPEAVLVNRVNVLEHQKIATDTEPQAMRKIHQYVTETMARSREPVTFIGYNSSRFDLPYLRTSFIRNGINPYFGRHLVDRDLFHAVQKLSCTKKDFPRPTNPNSSTDEPRLSLKLEGITEAFKLLTGAQTHESRDDVLITIKLAQQLEEDFHLDLSAYHPYEPREHKKGQLTVQLVPEYDQTTNELHKRVQMVLLQSDPKSALWVDLSRYVNSKDRSSISWFKRGGSLFVSDSTGLTAEEKEEWAPIAEKALEEFKDVRISNFFDETHCDIEQHIYRVDFDGIRALGEAIWENNVDPLKRIKGRDARVLYRRFQLRETDWSSPDDKALKSLAAYGLHRYGGELQLSKSTLSEEPKPGGELHETFEQLTGKITELKETDSSEDLEILTSLEDFYQQSPLYQACKQEWNDG